ncbi:uncharacterized protein MELLADRAFT_56873 [Melampsora larici-populina 98AG31]|uniref:Uncharacterized protein n=1 Tax=Melampsora larici-populina (strain 98AG31 / pathotype 3-4-7) TaxID=747676 RepID=F4RVR7_MELLP|nr:uncharacterized protein MELLADRAFT_56873 [Melampsora larici-populina 98AG31]EGG03539.1 hypothetical protein MELLADRAFT_56873 [Melampsora larici-populina 98AG31]
MVDIPSSLSPPLLQPFPPISIPSSNSSLLPAQSLADLLDFSTSSSPIDRTHTFINLNQFAPSNPASSKPTSDKSSSGTLFVVSQDNFTLLLLHSSTPILNLKS